MELIAGFAAGRNKERDVGGDIVLEAGNSAYSTGGRVNITSGFSPRQSSGEILLTTPVSGSRGESGRGTYRFLVKNFYRIIISFIA